MGNCRGGKLSFGKLSDGKLSSGKSSSEKLSCGKLSGGKLSSGNSSSGKLSSGKLSWIQRGQQDPVRNEHSIEGRLRTYLFISEKDIVRTIFHYLSPVFILIDDFSEPRIWGWFLLGIRVQSQGNRELLGGFVKPKID